MGAQRRNDNVLMDTYRHYAELAHTAAYEEWAADRLEELKEVFMKDTPFSVALEDVEGHAEMDAAWKRINEVRNMSRPREYDFFAGKTMTKIMGKAAQSWAEKELEKEWKELLERKAEHDAERRGMRTNGLPLEY